MEKNKNLQATKINQNLVSVSLDSI